MSNEPRWDNRLFDARNPIQGLVFTDDCTVTRSKQISKFLHTVPNGSVFVPKTMESTRARCQTDTYNVYRTVQSELGRKNKVWTI